MSDRRALARRLLAGAFSMLLLAVVAWLGQIPFGQSSPLAGLRLSLRTVQGQIEICRDRSESELAALPQHMRTPTLCVDHTPHYRLDVSIDGQSVVDQDVAPGGWRGDRPLIVDHRLTLKPGPAALAIRFTPVADASLASDQQEALARLPHYELTRQVEFVAGRVTLVTLDDTGGNLTLIDG